MKLGLYWRRTSLWLALFFSLSSLTIGMGSVWAEGTEQFNEQQSLQSSTVIYADILNSGETIYISVCSNVNIDIWNTNGTPANSADDTQVVTSDAFTANLACGASLPNPITTAYEYTPASTGTYRIQIDADQDRYDFSVTANATTDPDPTDANGRIWSYSWEMDAGSFAEADATDADLYILVPASNAGENFVWQLDLNNFAGFVYQLAANSLGLDPPYSGISADEALSTITPEFPIYLGYPAVAGPANSASPTISNVSFLDDTGEDNVFSPGGTPGVQDSGDFRFTTNVNNANYAITIDTNQDNVYGTGDRLLLGTATNGANVVNWDGTYPNGSDVPAGVYNAQIQIRMGEYHFIAADVETSGGTSDGGSTWTNGLTIYEAINATTTAPTTVYWDDLTELSGEDYPTANVPDGVTSGSLVDADSNNRADGFHTWGSFTGSGMGDKNNIDTYVYGPSTSATVTAVVADDEVGDNDGVTPDIETGAPNLGDGNDDGTPDFLQDDVTSLPNPETNNEYATLEVVGDCDALSNVNIFAESQLSATDAEYDYPVGLFNFSINCLAPGDTTQVTIYYDQVYDVSEWTPRKFLNGVYEDIPGAVFGTANIGGTNVTTLSYAVTDGGPLDADGTANGIIVDPVGPGENTLAETGAQAYFSVILGLSLITTAIALMRVKIRGRRIQIPVQYLG